jgi:acyl carrier protein
MDGSLGSRVEEFAQSARFDLATIETWLTSRIATLSEQADIEIDVTLPFSAYALSSLDTVGMTAALEDWLDISLDPTLFWDHPSIRSLARHLASVVMQQ